MMKKVIMMLVLGAWAAASQATLYFYEDFNYTANTKLVSSTTNWLNVGTPAQTNRSGSLSYAGLPAGTGGKEQLFGSSTPNNYGTAKRTLWGGTSGVADPGTTNLFASFLFNVASIGSPVAGGSSSASYVFNLRNGYYTTGGQGEVVVTNSGAGFKIGLKQYDKTLVAWDPAVYALNTTLLVVVSYTNGTGTNWTSQLWVNPALSPTMGTANATIAQAWYNSTNTAHVQIGPGNTANASGSEMYFDELRVGSTWGDVVIPEPATIGMLGFGALVMLCIRRMRR